jgi:hypothetical protein
MLYSITYLDDRSKFISYNVHKWQKKYIIIHYTSTDYFYEFRRK